MMIQNCVQQKSFPVDYELRNSSFSPPFIEAFLHFTQLGTLRPLPGTSGGPMFFFLTWRPLFSQGVFFTIGVFLCWRFLSQLGHPCSSRMFASEASGGLGPSGWHCGSCEAACRCIFVTSSAASDCPTWLHAWTPGCLHPGGRK